MVTMREVATRAGVSQPTVSHVLNERREGVYISEETRRRVLQTAREMGYRPNASAQAMKRGSFGCVALLLSTDHDRSNLPPRMLDGLLDALAERNLHLMLARLPDEKLTDDGTVPKILRQWMADGLLIDYTNHIPQRMMEIIEQHDLPVVWINSKQHADCVYPDDYDAGRRAAEHLLNLGHRRIAYADFTHLLNDKDEHYSARDRRAGYLDALRAAGQKPHLIEDARVGFRERVPYLSKQLSGAGRPTALLGYGPGEAEFAVVAATALKLEIPRDLSLLMFTSPGAMSAGRLLSSMTAPEYEVGQQAVTMLRRKIELPAEDLPPRALPFALAEGETCAARRVRKQKNPRAKDI